MERYCIEHERSLLGGFCAACLYAGLTRDPMPSVAMTPEQFARLKAKAEEQPIQKLFRAALSEVSRQRKLTVEIGLKPELRRCPLQSTGCGPDCELGQLITEIAMSYDDRSDGDDGAAFDQADARVPKPY